MLALTDNIVIPRIPRKVWDQQLDPVTEVTSSSTLDNAAFILSKMSADILTLLSFYGVISPFTHVFALIPLAFILSRVSFLVAFVHHLQAYNIVPRILLDRQRNTGLFRWRLLTRI